MEEIAQTNQLQFKPRGNGKYKADLFAKDIYKFYCEKTGNPYNKSLTEFTKILKDLNDLKFSMMINDAWTFKIPFKLGDLRIRKRKVLFKLDENGDLDTSLLRVDYKSTKDLWASDEKARLAKELIFHFNEHTDGYKFPWYWDKRSSNAVNQKLYKVVITRTHAREKARMLKQNTKLDYFE